MERIFKTLIIKESQFGANEYVKGRISGFMEVLCDGKRNGIDEPGFAAWTYPDVGDVLTTCCTQEEYDKFVDLVNKHYPNMCLFDVNPAIEEERP